MALATELRGDLTKEEEVLLRTQVKFEFIIQPILICIRLKFLYFINLFIF